MTAQVPQNGAAIRDFRLKEGRTQQNVANQVGVTKTWMSYVESERNPAGDLSLLKIARALGVSPASIVRSTAHGKRLCELAGEDRVRSVS